MRQMKELVSANKHYLEGRFAEARVACLEAIAIAPSNAEAWERLGAIALLQNQCGEARRFLEEASRSRPAYRRFWPMTAELDYRIAMTHYREDNFGAASAHFRKAAGPIAIGPFRDLQALADQAALFADGNSYVVEGPEQTRIAFLVTDPLPVLEVSVNGHGPLNFFLDTGGAEIILDREVATLVGANICGAMRSDYAGQKTAATGLGRVDSVTLGDLVVRCVPIHTLDVKPMSTVFDREVHGILGTRLLMHFLSTIDYANGALVLRRPDVPDTGHATHQLADGTTAAIPFWLAEMHCMLAWGSVNDSEPMLFFVDTGLAGAGFTASEAVLQRVGIEVDWSRATTGVGGAGAIRGTDFVVERVALGVGANAVVETNLRGGAIQGSVSILEGKLGFRVGGLISHQFFRNRSLTLDFRTMKLVLR